jgi:predicted dehydrogenase
VGTDTYVTCILEFDSGALVNLVATFGIWGADVPRLQIYGTNGVLNGPDPNTFAGPVRANLYADEVGWREVPLVGEQSNANHNRRGIGVIDMVQAVAEGRPPRASGVLAHHVVDVMQSVADSIESRRHVEVASTCERSTPLPAGTVQTRRKA